MVSRVARSDRGRLSHERGAVTWIFGHANAKELAALRVAYALAETDT